MNRNCTLKLPDKVTISWLLHNVPMSFWIWGISLIASTFIAGIFVGQVSSVKELVGKADLTHVSPNITTKKYTNATEPYISDKIAQLLEELSILRQAYNDLTDESFLDDKHSSWFTKYPQGKAANDYSAYKMLRASIRNADSADKRIAIINAYSNSSLQLTLSHLAELSSLMTSRDKLDTIKAISAHIRRDNDPSALHAITRLMSSTDSQEAIGILMNCAAVISTNGAFEQIQQ